MTEARQSMSRESPRRTLAQECLHAGISGAHPTGVVITAVATDGLDSASEAADAVVDSTVVSNENCPTAMDTIINNDAGGHLAARDLLVGTGDTRTNDNNLRHIPVGEGVE